MRKITAVLMALALALSLFACGGVPVQYETPGSDIQQGTVILPKPQENDESGDSQNGEYPSAQDPLPQKPGDTKKPEEPDKAEDGKNPGKNEDNAQTPAEDPKQEENNNNNNGDNATTPSDTKVPGGEYRAVWISYLELGGMLTGKTAGQFRSNIGAAYDNVKNLGCNTVIVHVRPFGDALYDSDYFPSSYLITGTEGDNLPFDPLKIMVEEAHNRGLTFEAWLNPYRVALNAATPGSFAENSLLYTHPDWVKANGEGYYLNPALPQVRDYICEGVAEIVQNYEVDGIHYDDYFYPTTDPAFDSQDYADANTALSLEDWRRENVNALVSETYRTIKSIRPACRFGISPQGNNSNNYNGYGNTGGLGGTGGMIRR